MAQFKTRARALDLLGRQQIAGIPTAINELIKNAHDAYADKFDIDFLRCNNLLVLRDDGLGMTKEECKLSLGNPTDVNSGHDWNSTIDFWQYPNGSYLRFQDGLLVSFRN